jgi:Protein of unknown function (DUF3108)
MITSFRSIAGACILGAAGLVASTQAKAESSQSWPTQVSAVYKLSFTGFGEVGKIQFQSKVDGSSYTSTGTAEVKVPLIYTWLSNVTGAGKLVADAPKPLTYSFSSKGKPIIGAAKNHSVVIGFKDNAVAQVNMTPPHIPGGPKYVPILPEHMKDALDPITAVMAFTRTNGASPCARRIPIFDGKQRFDLLMTSAGQQKVAETHPSGQPGIGYICKVRYLPISGHKNNEESKNASEKTDIEVALRPVPSANMLVPYRVTVVTKWGTGTMLLQRMDIVAPDQKQIALVH